MAQPALLWETLRRTARGGLPGLACRTSSSCGARGTLCKLLMRIDGCCIFGLDYVCGAMSVLRELDLAELSCGVLRADDGGCRRTPENPPGTVCACIPEFCVLFWLGDSFSRPWLGVTECSDGHSVLF